MHSCTVDPWATAQVHFYTGFFSINTYSATRSTVGWICICRTKDGEGWPWDLSILGFLYPQWVLEPIPWGSWGTIVYTHNISGCCHKNLVTLVTFGKGEWGWRGTYFASFLLSPAVIFTLFTMCMCVYVCVCVYNICVCVYIYIIWWCWSLWLPHCIHQGREQKVKELLTRISYHSWAVLILTMLLQPTKWR